MICLIFHVDIYCILLHGVLVGHGIAVAAFKDNFVFCFVERIYFNWVGGQKKIWWLFGAVVIACECCKSTIGQFIATTRISNSSAIKFRTLALHTNTVDQLSELCFTSILFSWKWKLIFYVLPLNIPASPKNVKKNRNARSLLCCRNFITLYSTAMVKMRAWNWKKTYVNQQTIQWNNNGEIVLFNHDTTYDACN